MPNIEKILSNVDDKNKLFVIDGVLSELHWELGSQNLLAKIDKHYKEKSLATGVGAAVSDMFGNAGSSAMVAMYDGDDTQNFMCLIGGEVVCGQFAGAQHMPQGGVVRAVVSRESDVLYVHAMLAPEIGLIWLHHPWGKKAQIISNLKWGIFLCLFALAGLAAIVLLADGFDGFAYNYFKFMSYGGPGIVIICLTITLWPIGDAGKKSTELFRLLGFHEPEKINLNNYRLSFFLDGIHSEYQVRDTYNYRKAEGEGKLKLSSGGCL